MQMLSHMAPPNAYEGQRRACEVVRVIEYSDTNHDRIVMRPVLPHTHTHTRPNNNYHLQAQSVDMLDIRICNEWADHVHVLIIYTV